MFELTDSYLSFKVCGACLYTEPMKSVLVTSIANAHYWTRASAGSSCFKVGPFYSVSL